MCFFGQSAERIEHHWCRNALAFLIETGAENVERGHQIFRKCAISGHFRPGAGHDAAFMGTGKHPRRRDQLILVHPRAFRRNIRGHGPYRCFQFFQSIDMSSDEILVVELLFEDHIEHAGKQRRVLARLHRQIDVGELAHFADPGIGHDHLEPAFLRIAQAPRRRRGRHAAGIMRDDRIIADKHCHVGIGEGVAAAHPHAIARGGEDLGRLVDGDAGVPVARTDALGKGIGGAEHGAVLKGVGAAIDRDAVGSVFLDHLLHPLAGELQRIGGGDILEVSVGLADLAGNHPVGKIVHVGKLAALDAGIAVKQMIFLVAAHGDDLVIFHFHHHCTAGVAKATKTAFGLDGHKSLLFC